MSADNCQTDRWKKGGKEERGGYPPRNMGNFVTESNLNCADLATAVSMENFNLWHKGCLCGIVKNVANFCPCLKSFPEAKVKTKIN